MTATITPAWIGVDWGTSHVRAWAISASGTLLAQASSDRGMGRLDRAGFEPALLALVGPWLHGPTPVIACGMVGSRQGWVEAPYAATPCAPLGGPLAPACSDDPRLAVHVIPGIKQLHPADVMRGEETQIAGYLAQNKGWDGVICLPGTHTKWVHVSAGEIVSFQTFMTGELFATLTTQTVLRHSIATDGWDDAAFDTGLADAYGRPEKLAGRLFSLRAEGLLHDLPGATARARLSGLLIGAELAAAKPYWLGQQIAVIGAGALARLYVTALAQHGAPATQVNAEAATLAGLTAAYRQLKG
ncbi:2-dehydro-3-deoxygalactonokinase [Yoonia vestfoldensis]|uniref:Putative 2-dehydro-3-deoxygalactonokinase n=1 Tax=Yoonia vestfoldensis SKA53 TaxID=314232 RepID=A3V950_9RHOB|nr:2-dehydro-3-deoxygalactonokinase [Yoonia vestfoldensis]EAQ05413.1 putative 2-dehydro-3-deoxygalactonokinase [Yoonia vestfoldensis SKA53]